jgi:ABC-type bacteriocin/lantibiotic exporter with double-glycine peptidase domain
MSFSNGMASITNRILMFGRHKSVKTGSQASWKVLSTLLGGFRFEYCILVVASSLMSGVEGIVHPLLVKSIFDEGVIKGGFHKFLTFVIAYLIFGLVVNVVNTGTALWSKSLENRLVTTISRRMLDSYYNKEYSSVLQNGHGYFINRVYGDLREGLVPLLLLVQTTIKQSVLLVSFALVLAYLSWQAFLFLAAIIPISAAVGVLLGRRIRALTSEEREQEGAVLAVLNKALAAFRIVKIFNLIPATVGAVDQRLQGYLSTSYRRYRVTRLFQALNDVTMVVSDFLSMFVGAWFVLKGVLTFGGFLAFVNTFWRAVTTLMQLFNRMADFHTVGAIMDRLTTFLGGSSRAYFISGASPSVQNISFSYGDTPTLKDFSLRLSPGEQVVIVGPNGSGKTTLANILSGFLSPSQGSVVLPDQVSSVTLPISFPPLRVKELVGDASLLSVFKLNDPAVLESYADELSAGQQQKLALSLALSRDADLYVIDEPLANLDPESRATAMNLIIEKTRDKNLILIMHGSEEFHKLFHRVITLDILSAAGDRQQETSVAI